MGPRTRRPGRRFGVLALCWLWSAPVYADDSPVRLAYNAPEECPDAAQFGRLVLGRSEHGRLVTDLALARSMTVTIRREKAGYVGRLEFFDLDAERVVRELRAPTCRALTEALVLVTALAIDAQLPADAGGPGLEAPDEYLAPSPLRFAPEPLPAPRRPAAPSPEPARRSQIAAGAEGRLDTAAVPGVGWGLSGFVEAARLVADERLRLGLSWGTGGRTKEGERARFDWLTVVATGCPVAFALGAVELLPCASLELGALIGHGKRSGRITSPETNAAAWAAVGLLAALHAPLGRSVALELEVGPVVPLTRPEFEFYLPNLVVFRPPGLGLSAGLGLSFELR